MTELKRFKRKDLVERNTKKDAAFVIDNQVYDITKFLEDHPGGHEVLLNVAGKDATESFNDIGHSSDAKQIMKKYLVGEVDEEDRIELKKRNVNWSASKPLNDDDSDFLSSWKFPVLLGLLVSILYSYFLG